jgi:hypothetical protein
MPSLNTDPYRLYADPDSDLAFLCECGSGFSFVNECGSMQIWILHFDLSLKGREAIPIWILSKVRKKQKNCKD